jgi:hypothetical protein
MFSGRGAPVTEQQQTGTPDSFIMTISFERTLMRDGRALLAMPPPDEHLGRVLTACASLMFAAALEQGIHKRLIIASRGGVPDDAPNTMHTRAIRILAQPFRERMLALPKLLSYSRCRLKWPSPHVQALHELVTLRNALCHVSEEHLSVTQDELTSPNPFLQRLMSKMVGLYIWAEVTRTDAERFEQAVDRYLEEIVNHPPKMVLTSGSLLVPT